METLIIAIRHTCAFYYNMTKSLKIDYKLSKMLHYKYQHCSLLWPGLMNLWEHCTMLLFSFHQSQLGNCLWTAYSQLTDTLQQSRFNLVCNRNDLKICQIVKREKLEEWQVCFSGLKNKITVENFIQQKCSHSRTYDLKEKQVLLIMQYPNWSSVPAIHNSEPTCTISMLWNWSIYM